MHLLNVTLHGPRPDAAEIRRDVRHGSGLRISPGAGTAPSRPGARGPLASFTEPCRHARGEAARFNGQGGQGNSRMRVDKVHEVGRVGGRIAAVATVVGGLLGRADRGARGSRPCAVVAVVYSSLLIVSRDLE
jgi:hypothetical protein